MRLNRVKVKTKGRKSPGIALLMALMVVLLLTTYISEFFFSAGLELRTMQMVKESNQAKNLSRLVLKAIQTGLLQDEVDFFQSIQDLEKAMALGGIPWEEGYVTQLKITPLDRRFNINDLYGKRMESPQEKVRWNLFLNTLKEMPPPTTLVGIEPQPLPVEDIQGIYAALFDWLDVDKLDYIAFPGTTGAEDGAYLSFTPEIKVKNGKLDRLTELRLIRGVKESKIHWADWEKHFTIHGKPSNGLYAGRINVNLATREEIIQFLKNREYLNPEELGSMKTIQEGLNNYALYAEDIADVLAPPDPSVFNKFTVKALKTALAGVQGINVNYHNQVFSLFDQYYRISIETMIGEFKARLKAIVLVVRNKSRVGTKVQVLALETN